MDEVLSHSKREPTYFMLSRRDGMNEASRGGLSFHDYLEGSAYAETPQKILDQNEQMEAM